MSDPDIKNTNRVGRFSLFLRKIKHTLTDDSNYYLMLTWEEIQALIDLTDENSESSEEYNKICSKMSEQLKWQAEGPT